MNAAAAQLYSDIIHLEFINVNDMALESHLNHKSNALDFCKSGDFFLMTLVLYYSDISN